MDVPNKKAKVSLDAPTLMGTKLDALLLDQSAYYKVAGPLAMMLNASADKWTKVAVPDYTAFESYRAVGGYQLLRKVRDGEIQTACQATCPTEAIVFGDINDPGSRVAKMKAEKLNFGMLADLNTRPRTTYLAALRNPNPELEA